MMERFRYSANALGLGGTVYRPSTTFSSFPSAVLSSTGGSADGHTDEFKLEGILSVRSASVSVRGGRSGDRESYSTFASVRLEDLNIMDVFTADLIVGRLAAEHQYRDQGRFSALGCQIQNMRIGGQRVEAKLDMDPFHGASYNTISERFDKDRRFRQRTQGDEDTELKPGKPVALSLLEGIETKASFVSMKGNSITISQFGTVSFCEVLVSPTTWKLEMLHVELGSPVGGEITAASVAVNGAWYP